MSPRLFELTQEVVKSLEFNEKLDFYVTNSAEINAYAISRLEEDSSHIINVNSGLVERLDDDELKFVIGHEIGHLISRNADIMKIIQFVFPDPNRTPLLLTHKIMLWRKLSELTADRFGYIASPNLEKCVSGFFKLSSGLDTARINFDYKAYLEENDKVLEYFKKAMSANLVSHPINPIRIKAIEIFEQSELFKALTGGSELPEDEKLLETIGELTEILLSVSTSELDYHRKRYIASAGILASNIDEDMTEEEYEFLIKNLASFTIFPKQYLATIHDEGKLNEVMVDSAKFILNQNPGERYKLFGFLIGLVMSDQQIFKNELSMLYDMGSNFFGFPRKEVAQMIAEHVNQSFMPAIYSYNM